MLNRMIACGDNFTPASYLGLIQFDDNDFRCKFFTNFSATACNRNLSLLMFSLPCEVLKCVYRHGHMISTRNAYIIAVVMENVKRKK